MAERRARRRRVPDRVDTTDPEPPAFDPVAWAEDGLDLLDHVRDAKPARPAIHEGRWRTRRAINALSRMLGSHPSFKDHAVRGDLAVLALALDGLDNFVEHDMLRKRKGGNRPPGTRLSRQFRLLVLQMVDHLILAGMDRGAAYKFLAAEITAAGQGALKPPADNPDAPFPPATIKRWYQRTRINIDAGKDAEAPEDADWLFWRSRQRQPDAISEAQDKVREWLALPAVRAVFPRCAKGTF